MTKYAKKTCPIMKVYDNNLTNKFIHKENKIMKKTNYCVEVATMHEAFELRDRITDKFGIDDSDMKAVVTNYGVRVIVTTEERAEGYFGLVRV